MRNDSLHEQLRLRQQLLDPLAKFTNLLLDVTQLLERQRNLEPAPILAILWHFECVKLFPEGLKTQLTEGIVRLVLQDQYLIKVVSLCQRSKMAKLLFYHGFSYLFIVKAKYDDRKLPIELRKLPHQSAPALLCVTEAVHR